MVTIRASRSVIQCRQSNRLHDKKNLFIQRRVRTSRVTVDYGDAKVTIYGRFLTSTLRMTALIAEFYDKFPIDVFSSSIGMKVLGSEWRSLLRQKQNHHTLSNWCAVFLNGNMVFGDDCPSAIVFIESIARGEEFTETLIHDVETRFNQLGMATNLHLVMEKALDLYEVGNTVECAVVTRSQFGCRPMKFSFDQARMAQNRAAALRVSARIFEECMHSSRELRGTCGVSDFPALNEVLSETKSRPVNSSQPDHR